MFKEEKNLILSAEVMAAVIATAIGGQRATEYIQAATTRIKKKKKSQKRFVRV